MTNIRPALLPSAPRCIQNPLTDIWRQAVPASDQLATCRIGGGSMQTTGRAIDASIMFRNDLENERRGSNLRRLTVGPDSDSSRSAFLAARLWLWLA